MKVRRNLLIFVATIWALKLLLTVMVGRSLAFPVLRGLISMSFDSISWISPRELSRRLELPGGDSVLLLDVRTEAEYRVSHLPRARRVEPDRPIPPDIKALPRATPIVAYCAVGYRSAAVAESLRTAGFTEVRNLTGSIFQWANEGHPLAADSLPAERVHPINWWWGILLRPSRRARLDS